MSVPVIATHESNLVQVKFVKYLKRYFVANKNIKNEEVKWRAREGVDDDESEEEENCECSAKTIKNELQMPL